MLEFRPARTDSERLRTWGPICRSIPARIPADMVQVQVRAENGVDRIWGDSPPRSAGQGDGSLRWFQAFGATRSLSLPTQVSTMIRRPCDFTNERLHGIPDRSVWIRVMRL